MPYLTSLGGVSKTTFLIVQNEKPAIEFTAKAAIKKGQPVKLDIDGGVLVWAQADTLPALIGYALSDAANTELVTVVTRGFVLINALSQGVQNAGLAGYLSYDTVSDPGDGTLGYNKYVVPAATIANAWALDAATAANLIIRILQMD